MNGIGEIVQAIPVLEAVSGTSLLVKGRVNNTWKIDTAQGSYVLRRQNAIAKRIGLDLSGEFEILRFAHAMRAGPQPVWMDAAAGLLLLEYLPGVPLTEASFKDEKLLLEAGALLRAIQGSRPDIRKVDYAGFVSRYSALSSDASARHLAEEALELIDSWCSDVDRHVLCHGDPLAQNFIAAPESTLKLIDWEYSGLGEPCFDLAVIIHHHNLDKAARRQLCDVVQIVDAEARLQGCIRLYERILALWLMTCCSSQEGPG